MLLNTVAITVDTKGAFLQISLAPEERDEFIFLWITNDLDAESEVLRMTHMIFKTKSCSFLMNLKIKHLTKRQKDAYPDAFSILNGKSHVDHLIHSIEDADLACTIHE